MIEMLTEKRDGQNVIPLRQDGANKWALCSAGMGEAPAQYLYGDHADRLAAYEETGLEPDVCAEYKKFEDEAVSKGVTFKRIVELMEAEQDGRLVVLPCVAQTDIARDGYTFRGDHWSHTLTAFRDDPTSPSGMRVALFSIEEAVAALKKGEQHGTTDED